MAIPDGGGSSGPGFDTGSPYYESGMVDTSCVSFQGGASGESVLGALWSGGGATRGAVEDAMKAANPDGLTAKAGLWDDAFSEVCGYTNTMNSVYNQLAAVWTGDDADQALKTLGGLHATLADQIDHTGTMSSSLKDMASDLSACKGAWGHDSSTLGGFGNWVTGDDDRAAANDYNKMVSNFNVYMERMPHQVPTQVKPFADPYASAGTMPAAGVGGPSGEPSVGGPGSAAHVGDPAATHIGSPGVSDPHVRGPRSEQNPPGSVRPPSENLHPLPGDPGSGAIPPGDGGLPPGAGVPPGGIPTGPGVGGPHGGFAGVPGGGGIGSVPPVGSTLASYHPGAGGVGGAVPGAGGAGGMPSSVGAAADGSGLYGSGTAGLEPGLLMGGAGGGSSAAEGSRSTGVPAGGANAAGARGVLPMRGGAGSGDDEDEHERSTWLSEDDDVWGGEHASSVIVS